MATASSIVLPQDIPILLDYSQFSKWELETSLFVDAAKHLNKQLEVDTLASIIFPRLLMNVKISSLQIRGVFDDWDIIRKKVLKTDPSIESLTLAFKEFVLEKLGKPFKKFIRDQISEWHTSTKSRNTIYEEALFYLKLGIDDSLIADGLERCDSTLFNEATLKLDEYNIILIVEIMRKREELLSAVQGQDRLNKPFNSGIAKVEFKRKPKNFKKSSNYKGNYLKKRDVGGYKNKVKCYRCQKFGHIARFCKEENKEKVVVNYICDFIYANIKVGNKKLRGLIDSGSSASLIRKKNVDPRWIKHGNRSFLTANKSILKAHGKIDAVVTIDNREIPYEFFVVDELSEDAIIGIDFISKYKISMDFAGRKATINSIKHTDLTNDFKDILVNNLENAGEAKVEPIEIRVKEKTEPVYQHNYKMSEAEWEVVEREINKMMESGVIEEVDPTLTEKSWNSPIILIKKPDNSWRFCIDFRKLNNVTIKEPSHLPSVEDILDDVSNSKYFSKLDLVSGYWQFLVKEESRKFLRFETRDKQYQFKVMPFGITNAPAIFQRTMKRILGDIRGCLVLIDDIIIFSETRDDNIRICKNVLSRLRQFNLKVKISKCVWMSESLNLFGFTIGNGKLGIEEKRVDAINKIKKPETIKELQSFLGVCNYFRRLIKNYAEMETKIRSSINKDGKIEWTKEAEDGFYQLRNKLKCLPMTYGYDPKLPTTLQCDASNNSIGAVLMQKHGDLEVPIYYYSKMLTRSEKNYSITEKELLAVYKSIIKLRHFLYGLKFIIKTDHKPLVSILKYPTANMNIKWVRRLLKISEMEFDVCYIKGKDNVIADTLSRINYISVKAPNLIEAQSMDKDINYFMERDKRVIYKNGIAYIRIVNKGDLLLLPKEYHYEILMTAHGNENGHFGIRKTIDIITQKFFWKGIYNDIKQFIKTCEYCLKNKKQKNSYNIPMHLEKRDIWTDLAIDIIGPMENVFALVVIDMFSKYVRVVILERIISSEIIKSLEKIFKENGYPKSILTDNGSQLVSREIEDWMVRNNIIHKKTSIYNPQGNGIVERVNKTIKDGTKIFINQGFSIKESLLKSVENYNKVKHDTTGFSPYEIVFRESPNIFEGIEFLKGIELNKPIISKNINEEVKRNIERRERKIEKHMLGNTKKNQFKEGELVYYKNPNRRNKMEPYALGPVKIKRKVNEFAYILEGFNRPFNIRSLIKRGFVREQAVELKKEDKTTQNLNIIPLHITVLNEYKEECTRGKEDTTSSESYESVEDEDEEYVDLMKKELKERITNFKNGILKLNEIYDALNVYLRSGRSKIFNMIKENKLEEAIKEIESMDESNFKV